MSKEKLTICIHFGKKTNYPFLQNFLKSFLICNTFPNIELKIYETSGDKEIRNWLKKINLNNFFINFEGSITKIKKNINTKPKLKLIFSKKIFKGNFWVPYMESFINESYRKKGGFFIFLAEDCQYFLKGDIVQNLVEILKKLEPKENHLSVCVWGKYRYNKDNNKVNKVIKINNYLSLFQTVEPKADILLNLVSRKLFHFVGKINKPKNTIKSRHSVILDLTKKFKKNNIKRYYSSIAPIMILENDYHEYFINKIKSETKRNPNFVLCKILTKKEFLLKFKNSTSKLISVENLYKLNRWYYFLKNSFLLKKSLNYISKIK